MIGGLHEECGVFGVWGVPHAAELTYYALHSLQHRGQEGCGIVSVGEDGQLRRVKGLGLVSKVFDGSHLAQLPGNCAIGHVRYSTAGGGGIENVQPFFFRHHTGDFALAHNGNSLFHATSDSEILAHLIKKSTFSQNDPRIFSIVEALNRLEGAFAFLIMTKNRIYAARDKYGFRPLSLGRLGDGYVVSSETCAFGAVGAEFIRDLEPGEVVTIDHHGLRCRKYSDSMRHAMCAMEYIYFSRPDSDIESRNVHTFRRETGRLLATEAPADADIVVGVPDSSLSAAMGYSDVSGLPYEMGLIKNKYIARTFIQPSQELRDKGVKMKLSPVRSIIAGKRVVLIPGDDFVADRPDAARSGCDRGARAHRQSAHQISLLLRRGHQHVRGAAVRFADGGTGAGGHRGRFPGLPVRTSPVRCRKTGRPVPGLLQREISYAVVYGH